MMFAYVAFSVVLSILVYSWSCFFEQDMSLGQAAEEYRKKISVLGNGVVVGCDVRLISVE